jgi:tetratricopeptide (TPR) repeat protein
MLRWPPAPARRSLASRRPGGRSAPAPRGERLVRRRAPTPAPAASRADDEPLTAKIDAHARGRARRCASRGRSRLAAATRKLELLERAVAGEAGVPYAYYFLAKAHAEAGHSALAQRFLDRAEQKLVNEPYWQSEVYGLRGKLLALEGKTAEAEASYRRALEVWPGNRAAVEALTAAAQRDKETP